MNKNSHLTSVWYLYQLVFVSLPIQKEECKLIKWSGII